MENRIALVLGATGGIGGEVAARLVAAGWQVRALNRNPERSGKDGRFLWFKGTRSSPVTWPPRPRAPR